MKLKKKSQVEKEKLKSTELSRRTYNSGHEIVITL